MASLSTDKKSGARRIQFQFDVARRTIHMGVIPIKAAQSFRLLARGVACVAEDQLADRLRDRDVAGGDVRRVPRQAHPLGLIEPRHTAEIVTLGALLDRFFASYSGKESSRVRMRQARTRLEEFFGGDAPPTAST